MSHKSSFNAYALRLSSIMTGNRQNSINELSPFSETQFVETSNRVALMRENEKLDLKVFAMITLMSFP